MSELLREIDEELRYERLQEQWKRHRTSILTILGLIILAVAASSAWTNWKQQQAEQATEAYLAWHDIAEQEEKRQQLEEWTAHAPDGLAAIAQLRYAAWLTDSDKPQMALNAYQHVMSNEAALEELAALGAGYLSLQQDGVLTEGATPRVFGSPFMEMQAMALWQSGKEEEATALLDKLADDVTAPPTLRERAQQLRLAIAPKRVADTAPDQHDAEGGDEVAP